MTLKTILTVIDGLPHVYMYNHKTYKAVYFDPPFSDEVLKLKVEELYSDAGLNVVLKWNKNLAK